MKQNSEIHLPRHAYSRTEFVMNFYATANRNEARGKMNSHSESAVKMFLIFIVQLASYNYKC